MVPLREGLACMIEDFAARLNVPVPTHFKEVSLPALPSLLGRSEAGCGPVYCCLKMLRNVVLPLCCLCFVAARCRPAHPASARIAAMTCCGGRFKQQPAPVAAVSIQGCHTCKAIHARLSAVGACCAECRSRNTAAPLCCRRCSLMSREHDHCPQSRPSAVRGYTTPSGGANAHAE